MDTHEGKTRGNETRVQLQPEALYIVPRWGEYPLQRVTSVEVEEWLKVLKLAPSSRAKIRNLMSTVFCHAIRWGWIGQHENPITLVRVSAKRKRVPETLTAEEFRMLFAALPDRERALLELLVQRPVFGSVKCWVSNGKISIASRKLRTFCVRSSMVLLVPARLRSRNNRCRSMRLLSRNCSHGESSVPMAQMRTGSLAARGPLESCQSGPTVFATRFCNPLRKRSASGNGSGGTHSDIPIARCWRRPETM